MLVVEVIPLAYSRCLRRVNRGLGAGRRLALGALKRLALGHAPRASSMKTNLLFRLIFLGAVMLLALHCAAESGAQRGSRAMTLTLTTNAFSPGGTIPRKYTCDGPDVSPGMKWTEAPSGTQSFALIVDDPDAPVGLWVHWVVYDLSATAVGLAENVPKTERLASGGAQGRNDFRKIGYGGPCPPPGPAHRYFFKLYALDAKLSLKPGATKAEIERAMKGHVLAEAQLIGKYGR